MKTYTVVSIEDESEISELLSVVLFSPAVKLIFADTASAGLDLIRRIRPALVILDIMLPDMDGWSVYDALRGDPQTAQIPVIMLTVLRREFQPRRTFRPSPHDAYITKPFDTLQLRHQVEQMLGEVLWYPEEQEPEER
ncbi:MAG TPA: response regulator [Aggregatilineales bacterium]|nr:response regulator [Aggregatilineales bacterium]